MTEPLTFFIIAGESSGDRLGANLMAGLKAEYREPIRFVGVGGPLMQNEGLDSLFPMDELSVMGIGEVLPKIPNLRRRIRETADAIGQLDPTALITIDSPDFCFRVARKVKDANPSLKVVHYVAPSVWAWRPKRAKKMARFVDHVLAILPFEPPYMEAEGMSCDFVGHPITNEIQATESDAVAFRKEFGIREDQQLLTVLPGSRSSEVSRLAPIFKEVITRLCDDNPDICIAIPSVGSRVSQLKEVFDGLNVTILDPRNVSPEVSEQRKRACYRASDVALAASGTVSLELAAAGTPMVIAYQMNWLTAFIKRRMVRVSSATLVNLLTETNAVPEFLLEECTVEKIYPEVRRLLSDREAREAQREVSARAIHLLGAGENRAAKSVLNFLKL